MSWARLDDRFHENRKVRGLWRKMPAALGLHVLAITYCAGHETDGFVDIEFLADKVPSPATRRKMTAALVDSGIWTEELGGFSIHDYLEYNPSRASMNDKRERDAVRKARGRANGAHASARTPDGHDAESARTDADVRAESDGPVPTRPDPTPDLRPVDTSANVKPITYRGRRIPADTVAAGEQLCAVFAEATGRPCPSRTKAGEATPALKQIIGALQARDAVPVDIWEHAIRGTVAKPPGWADNRPLVIGDVFGDKAAEHALAKSNNPAVGGEADAQMKAFREHQQRLAAARAARGED